jgi:hypothetical protein
MSGAHPVFATAGGAARVRNRTAALTLRRSMHVLGNVANLVLYFSLPPSHTANLPAAATCVVLSAAVAVFAHRFMRCKT